MAAILLTSSSPKRLARAFDRQIVLSKRSGKLPFIFSLKDIKKTLSEKDVFEEVVFLKTPRKISTAWPFVSHQINILVNAVKNGIIKQLVIAAVNPFVISEFATAFGASCKIQKITEKGQFEVSDYSGQSLNYISEVLLNTKMSKKIDIPENIIQQKIKKDF